MTRSSGVLEACSKPLGQRGFGLTGEGCHTPITFKFLQLVKIRDQLIFGKASEEFRLGGGIQTTDSIDGLSFAHGQFAPLQTRIGGCGPGRRATRNKLSALAVFSL